ncbi:helicase C-terminal domain protein [Leptospira santarosai str. CBC379]|uniref:SNF2-related protein n=1 Tax=Leptospira santarosai TaxID=28183 RepID=UPI0002981CF9|nr:SNF2-related protein [Leptospira santarosai]EKR89701.1 helicase C-terminal domain protein [Leptospira santarosai str. CBC379]
MKEYEIIQSFLKGRKFEVGRESVRKDGIYRKISDTGEKSKQWKLVQKHNEDKKRFSKVLEAITNFFGIEKKIAKTIPKREYNSNEIESKGISLHEWTRHFTKYFEIKSQIDAKFHQEKNAKEANSTIIGNKYNSNQVNSLATKKPDQNNEKSTFKKSIFKLLYDLYGNRKSNKTNESNKGIGLQDSIDEGSRLGISEPSRNGKSGQVGAIAGKSALISRQSRNRSLSRVSSDRRITKEESIALSVAEGLNTFRVLWSKKRQNEINLECKRIVSTIPHDQISMEQKEILKLYEGFGGQTTNEEVDVNRGMLYQFLTPRKIVEKMQDILSRYVKEGNRGLEPSAGIGRFAEGKGEGYNWDMMEYNPDDKTAFSIAKILNPNANVSDKAFETLFINDKNKSVGENYTGKKYQFVAGNPPYGSMEGKYKAIEGKGWKRYEHYFINRGIDVLEEGGILTFIVPQSFLNANNEKWKNQIFEKAELLEAYRLPERAFSNTQVGTDIIVLRKNTTNSKNNSLAFSGKYFERNSDHVFGSVEKRKNRFGKEEDYVKGEIADFLNFNLPLRSEMSEAQKAAISKGLVGNTNAKGKQILKSVSEAKKVNKKGEIKEKISNAVRSTIGKDKKIDPKDLYTQEEFIQKYGKKYDQIDLNMVRNMLPTGSLPEYQVFNIQKMSKMNNEIYPDFIYASGDLTEKLRILEIEKNILSPEEYTKQKNLLESLLPEKVKLENIILTPIEPFAKGFMFEDNTNLIEKFKKFILGEPVVGRYGKNKGKIIDYEGGLPNEYFMNYTITKSDILSYLNGEKVTGRNDVVYDKVTGESTKIETNKLKKKERKEIGNKLFQQFIQESLSNDERDDLAKKWNEQYNSVVNIDGSKIPVVLEGMSKFFKGNRQDFRPTQTNFISRFMTQGVGCATHEVGLGKTWTGMASNISAMQSGKCKKPLIIVPTSVLQNWALEFKERFPNVPIRMVGTPELNNLNKSENGFQVEEGVVTIMSYDAFTQFGFSDERYEELTNEVRDQIYNPDNSKEESREKKREKAQMDEKSNSIVSEAVKGTRSDLLFDKIGFDHITVDEAHNFNNIFVDVASTKGKAENKLKGQDDSGVNEFDGITGGTPSARGIKLWLAARHILEKNNDRNVLLLSATPFTNNPLQIYSLLSIIAKKRMEKIGITNIRDFLGTFVETRYENMIEGNGKVVNKQVVRSFKNAQALQNLISEYFDFQSGDKNGVERPNLKMKAITLPLTNEQEMMRNQLESMYDLRDASGGALGGAPLVSILTQQMMNISPALVKKGEGEVWNYVGEINPEGDKNIVQRSPKLQFIADSLAEFYNQYKKSKPGERIPGQLMFMPKGVEYISKIKQYLMEKHGIPENAIGILTSDTKIKKAKDPELAKQGLSRFTEISDQFNSSEHPCKILIGSDVIKEGVSLNNNTIAAYNASIDWNPTTEVQKRGRHHRPGNLQKDVQWIDILMEDSIDSKLYQKQSEKISRINQIFEKSGSAAIDVSEINPEELKTEIIRDPKEKRYLLLMKKLQR